MSRDRALVSRPSQGRRDVVVGRVLLTAAAASAAVHVAVQPGKVAYVAALLLAAASAWVTRRCHHGSERSAWGLIAVGLGLTAGGDLVEAALSWRNGATPDISVADLLWTSAYAAILLGVARLGRGQHDTARRGVDVTLDVLVAATVTLFVVWEVALRGLLADHGVPPFVRFVWATYPVLDAALITLVLHLAITGRASRWAVGLLGAGAVGWFVTDLVFLVSPSPAASLLAEIGWMASLGLMAAAASVPSDGPTPRRRRSDEWQRGRLVFLMLPMLAPAALVLQEPLLGQPIDAVGTVVAAVVLVTLCILRVRRLLVEVTDARTVVAMQRERFRALAAHSADAGVVIDHRGLVAEVFGNFAALVGVSADVAIGRDVRTSPLVRRSGVERLIASAFEHPEQAVADEVVVRQPGEEDRWLSVRLVNLLGDPSVAGIVVNLHDVTERKRVEAELVHRASYDSLTGLARRAVLGDLVDDLLRRASDPDVALLYLDVDGFKRVNDRFGHEAGDRLLCVVAERLRSVAPPGAVAARLGGDEFALAVPAGEYAAEVASDLLEVIGRPVDLDGHLFVVTGSIGLARSRSGLDSADDLLHAADIAMYRAKGAGKAQVVVYEPAMGDDAGTIARLTSDLPHALRRGELRVEYQPVVVLATGEVVGYEALLRWHHPELGLVAPSRFVPLAEESALIVDIGRWVLETACATLAPWCRASPHRRTIAVNVSARQLRTDAIVDQVRSAIDDAGLDPGSLVLELTESALIDDAEDTARRLRALSALGVTVAVDDFGTGYSSLDHLRRFPVDILKIDRAFVETIGADAPPIVRALVDLGGSLGLELVAEGIEREEQRRWLCDAGCTYGQGFLFSASVPAAELDLPDPRAVPTLPSV